MEPHPKFKQKTKNTEAQKEIYKNIKIYRSTFHSADSAYDVKRTSFSTKRGKFFCNPSVEICCCVAEEKSQI